MARLVRVELRKAVDTRAGRWLLIAIGAITLAAIVLYLIFAESEEKNFNELALIAGTPQGFLLPILGILAITSEWSQRTGLVTFTLEPRRQRVLAAKVIAVMVLGLAALVLLLVFAAMATIIAAATGDGGSWHGALGTVGKLSLIQFLGLLGGLAFGVVFLNSAAAIVLSFVLPLVIGVVLGIIPALQDAAPWIDINTAGQPLFDDGSVDAEVWLHLAVTSLWWVVVPIAVGTRRVLHTEVK
jgi:ABC-type transport system involved in multi-copper enzyme maturation permease subunit